jgi:integrase
MALHKLGSAKQVEALAKTKEKRLYGDGGGLYLRVAPPNASWVFRFMVDGQARTMGLGPFPDISLAMARDRAQAARRAKLDGQDPIDKRKRERAERRAARAAQAERLTFKKCAMAYIDAKWAGWSEKHAVQWPHTMKAYVYPVFGDLPVDEVDTGLVLKAVQPIWETKTETAKRTLLRIEKVLDWAKVGGHRKGDNPARWKGHLEHKLVSPAKIMNRQHHAALHYNDLPAFMPALREQVGISPLALEFTILAAARTGEVTGATWQEFDLSKGEEVWTIPAERMKARKEHRVPLSDRAVTILTKLKAINTEPTLRPEAYVFPGGKKGAPLSNMAMAKLLERMERTDLTVHGFRSTFRDWAGETTSFPRDVIEHALAHQLKDKAEAAYFRGELMDKRRDLMAAWAKACTAPPGSNVRQLTKAVAA